MIGMSKSVIAVTEVTTMSEDDPTLECCPICKGKECEKHLLARLDASGDQGEFGVGLAGGSLQKVYEIKDVLQRARLAWVQSVRASGTPKAPPWIMKELARLIRQRTHERLASVV
jgi:hypothetical protein